MNDFQIFQRGNLEFYVETQEMSKALQDLNTKLMLSDGKKLFVKTVPSTPPPIIMTADVKEKIKLVMGSPDRYKARKRLMKCSIQELYSNLLIH